MPKTIIPLRFLLMFCVIVVDSPNELLEEAKMTGIQMIDREYGHGAFLGVSHNSFEASMRLFMTIARWRAVEQGEKNLILIGPASLESQYKRLRTPIVPHPSG